MCGGGGIYPMSIFVGATYRVIESEIESVDSSANHLKDVHYSYP